MRREFRDRAFLPIVVPIAVLVAVVAAVGLVAFVLLYNTHQAALALAAVMAAGILITVSLAASQDRLTAGRKLTLVAAGSVPVLLGAGFALGVFGTVDPTLLNINREALQDPAVAAGRDVVAAQGCASCHSTDGTAAVGPTWQNLWGSEVTLNSGETVTVDREYIRRSIREPNAFARDGFTSGVMPPFELGQEEINDIIAYMQTLSDHAAETGATDGTDG